MWHPEKYTIETQSIEVKLPEESQINDEYAENLAKELGIKDKFRRQMVKKGNFKISFEKHDVEIDMDQEITLHDGTITTLAKEAEALNIAPDEYKKQFAEREADCYADKVELIREEQAEEQSAERAEEHEERAERSLENDAWERIRKHQ